MTIEEAIEVLRDIVSKPMLYSNHIIDACRVALVSLEAEKSNMDDKIKNAFKSTKIEPLDGMEFTYELQRRVREDEDNFIFETIEPFCSDIAQQKISKQDLNEAIQLWIAVKRVMHKEGSDELREGVKEKPKSCSTCRSYKGHAGHCEICHEMSMYKEKKDDI